MRRRSSQMRSTTKVPVILDAAPLALDNQHVVQPQRLRQRQLQARDQVAEHRPRGQAANDASTPADASRLAPTWRAPGKVMSAMAVPAIITSTMAARQHPGLGLGYGAPDVVAYAGRMPGDDAVGQTRDRAHHEPGQRGDQQHTVGVPDGGDVVQVVRCDLPDDLQG